MTISCIARCLCFVIDVVVVIVIINLLLLTLSPQHGVPRHGAPRHNIILKVFFGNFLADSVAFVGINQRPAGWYFSLTGIFNAR